MLAFPLRQVLLRLLLTRRSASWGQDGVYRQTPALSPAVRVRCGAVLVDVFAARDSREMSMCTQQHRQAGPADYLGLDGLEPRRLHMRKKKGGGCFMDVMAANVIGMCRLAYR
jgi:hypothetical protein